MLAIRMQRTGRSGHAQFRVIVQDGRFSPKSGRVVAYVGSYNPHSKAAKLDIDKISQYLANGAQPSDSVARLLKKEGVKLPDWVKLEANKEQAIKHPEKLRKNRPASSEAPAPAAETDTSEESPEAPKDEASAETPAAEVPEEPAVKATEESNQKVEKPVSEATKEKTEKTVEETVPAVAEAEKTQPEA